MTRGPGGTALVAAVGVLVAADPAAPLAAVVPYRGREPTRWVAREMSERVNVRKDTP